VLVSGLLTDLVFSPELGIHYNICVDVIIVILFTNLASATCRQKHRAVGEDGSAIQHMAQSDRAGAHGTRADQTRGRQHWTRRRTTVLEEPHGQVSHVCPTYLQDIPNTDLKAATIKGSFST